MRCLVNHLVTVAICLLCLVGFSGTALADGSHDRTQFGHNISIGPNEEVSDVTCFGCSIRVKGHVAGDATCFGGSIIIEQGGQVAGDVTTFAGDLRLDKGVTVKGDATVFGGQVRRDPESSIRGEVTTFGGTIWLVLIFGLPFFLLGGLIALAVWLIRLATRPTVPASA